MKGNNDLRVVIGSIESKNNVGWKHTEENELNLLKRSDWETIFAPNSITAILAEHVWEHFNYEEGVNAAKTITNFMLLF